IVYVVSGKVSVTTYDGNEINITNDEMLFMPRDSYVISDYLNNGKNMEVFLLFFGQDIVMEFLDRKIQRSTKQSTICKLEVTDNIRNYLLNIEKMQLDNPNNKALLKLKLLEFLHLIDDHENFKQTLEASEIGKQTRDIESFMLAHYDKNMTVADFASLSGRSLSTFNREFKKKHHTTPKQWLIEKKMHKAKELLEEGNTVTQSAFDVGYNNVSNFIKAYKSIYHETPKTMQKNLL
ncbi:MAG TPA: AraC family transcriptional regulator, partial [Sulfurovum sp.]|nr:AraC family transcriptional regulator [Sulfurovum sp.]